jgi:hypothetical protein
MMTEVILLVIGAILGVIADIFLRQTILRFVLRIRRLIAKLTKRADPLAGHPDQLRFGNITTEWVSLHGTGELPLLLKHIRTYFVEEYVTLPRDLEVLRDRRRKELAKKVSDTESDIWNGERFALTSFNPTRYGRTEEIGLNFEFKLTDYAAFFAITLKADQLGLVNDDAGNPTTIREKYFPYFDLEKPNPYLTHSFGINLVVITKDHKVILTQRNAFVANKKKFYSIPMNEGMQHPSDLDELGRPSFLKTATRGLWEELGIDPQIVNKEVRNIEFLNFGALARANEYALLGRVKLPIDSRELEQAYHVHAKDKAMETRHELYAVDYIPDVVLEFVNQHSPWTYNALATLYYMMVREWGYWETKRALAKQPMEWNIVTAL